MFYGINFDFRVPPTTPQRGAKFAVKTTLAIGAPVFTDGTFNDRGELYMTLATGAQAPKVGVNGLIVYEYIGAIANTNVDPHLDMYSDNSDVYIDLAGDSEQIQLVSGKSVKVVFHNVDAYTFLRGRAYPQRTMVAGLSSLTVGDMLTPGIGTNAGGYWAKTTDPTKAWMVVTAVSVPRNEIDARIIF